eukprot:1162148-Amphidinium_carterae.1
MSLVGKMHSATGFVLVGKRRVPTDAMLRVASVSTSHSDNLIQLQFVRFVLAGKRRVQTDAMLRWR